MEEVLKFLSRIADVSPDHLVGIITLVAMGVAIFALYVVLAVVKERGK